MPSESTDITDQILAHHEWFREQFVRLDDAKAASPKTPTPCARCGTRWPRSSTCTPSPRRRSSTRSCCGAAPRTPRRPRSTRSATTTTSATACTRPTTCTSSARRSGGRPSRRPARPTVHGAGGTRGHRRLPRQRPGGPARGTRPRVRALLRGSTERPTGRMSPRRTRSATSRLERESRRPGREKLARDRQFEGTMSVMTAIDACPATSCSIPAKAWEEIESEACYRLSTERA